MDNIREISYKINNLKSVDKSVIKDFEDDFSNVKGVLGVKIDFDNSTVTYAIDEWTSDYDVLCKLNEICDEKGLDLSFDDVEKSEEDEQVSEIENEEEVLEEENIANDDEDLSKIQEGDEFDEKEEKVKDKLSKSDFIEKAIIFGLAFVGTLLGLFIKGDVRPWILMIAFTLASYETLYDVIIKIAEKKYFLDEILTFIGALVFMYLGYTEVSAIIMLIFSAISFVKALLLHFQAVKKEIFKNELESLPEDQDKTALQSKIEYFEENYGVCDLGNLKTYSNKLKISIAFAILSVLVIFIPPFFSVKTYWASLSNKWLYAGACVLTLSSFGEFFFSCFNTANNALLSAYQNNVRINDYDKFLSLTKVDKFSFEVDGVLLDESGNAKADLDGAIKELKYDLSISSEILSSQKAEKVAQIKKGYEFSGAIAGASNNYKKERLTKHNSVYVSNGNLEEELLSNLNCSIAFVVGGNVTVLDSELKRVPFIVKLSKRTDKILNFNKFFNLFTKVFLLVLTVALTVFTSFNYALLIYALDAIFRAVLILNSQRNLSEVV